MGRHRGEGDIGKSEAQTTAHTPQTKPQPYALDKLASKYELFKAFIIIGAFAGLFIAGRIYWDERYYIAEEGLGYYLGLVGGIMMLLALAYSLFKHVSFLRNIMKLRVWLEIHIVFGIAGPLLVMIHSMFQINSLNGGIALVSMLLVLLSGIIGKYLYSKTHYGLGGHRAKLSDLHAMLNSSSGELHSERLAGFTAKVLGHSNSLIQACWEFISYGIRSRIVYWRVYREMSNTLTQLASTRGWFDKDVITQRKTIKRHIKNYLTLLRVVALYKLFERFFAFWRRAHVPLLYLLVISAAFHVLAVHMY